MAELTCPKCRGEMRTYERNGVHVDQCSECRGIFLDRGELERLVDAENAWHGPAPQAAPAQQGQHAQQAATAPQHGTPAAASPAAGAGLGAVVGEVLRQAQSSRSHSTHGSYGSYGHPKRKKSFLDELFG